jgi:glycosyltransferase involved in cell wall biosynthesis
MGRALARLICTAWVGVRVRPDLFMGYHLIPNSVIALVVGRLLSRATCYQMTTGPNEVIGGGFRSDNPILSRLSRPSAFLERLSLAVVREVDLVVVRGSAARRFLAERGVAEVAVITGSVDPERFRPGAERPYDLLYVGQLIPRKRPLEFLEILAEVAREVPGVNAAMVGDGVLMDSIRMRAAQLGVADRVELAGQSAEVHEFFARSRVFLLTSRSEGLSIAMAEAMMSGAVPVVADVGDLGDLVRSGVNGYLVDAEDRAAFVRRVKELLRDGELWQRLSRAATESARAGNGLDRVAELWARHLPTVGVVAPPGLDTANV